MVYLYCAVCITLQDLSEFGIAPKVIATKEKFASNERERKRKADISSALAGESILAGAESVFVDLVLPRKYVLVYVEFNSKTMWSCHLFLFQKYEKSILN